MKKLWLMITGVFAMTGLALAASPVAYHIADKIVVGGSGHWDYLLADGPTHQLYMSHGPQVDVIDTLTRRKTGSITTGGVTHGIVVIAKAGRGYITVGSSREARASTQEVDAFDLKTHAILQRIQVAKDPDALLYDAASDRVVAFSGDGETATVIAPASGQVIKAIPLSGSPEAAVADTRGNIFVNIHDTNHLSKIVLSKLAVTNNWPIAHCDGPTGIAMNNASRRVFVACANETLAVFNANTGATLKAIPIAPKNDGAAFDPATRTIFVSTASGVLSIIRDTGRDHYRPLQALQTPKGSRTIALDDLRHVIYLASSAYQPLQAGQRYPDPTPGTFAALEIRAAK